MNVDVEKESPAVPPSQAIEPAQKAPQPQGTSDTTKAVIVEHGDVIELARSRNVLSRNFNIANVRRGYVHNYDLFIVTFDQDNVSLMNYVLKRGGDLELFRNDSQLMDGLVRMANKPSITTVFFSSQMIPGIIALIITCCIAFLVLRDPDNAKVPDILSSGLALILGFYFGKSTNNP